MKPENIYVITDFNGMKVVLINDIRFRGKREEWDGVEELLKEYVGKYYEIEESCEKIFVSSDFPDEFAHSNSRTSLKGAVAKAKANSSLAIPELIRIAINKTFSDNNKVKHKNDAKFGWYRYDVRFALPVYDDKTGALVRYNIYKAVMLVRHSADGNKYLYDFISIKKETSSPLES